MRLIEIRKESVFITIGFGNIGSGPWFYTLNKLMAQDFRCIFLVRYSSKWEFSKKAKNLNLFAEDTKDGNHNFISSMPVVTRLKELNHEIQNNRMVLFLYEELEDILNIFEYVKNIFTCLGSGFEEVVRKLHGFGFANNIYALENDQKNIELLKMDLLKQGTKLNIYPTILDCIAPEHRINEENLVVKYEVRGYFHIIDPNNNLNGVFENNKSEILLKRHTNSDSYEPLKIKKEVTVNIPHRVLCYLYLFYCNKNKPIEEYQYIASKGETYISDILKVNIIIASFDEIVSYIIIGKNAVLSDDGLTSIYEENDIQRVRQANYIIWVKEILKTKQRFAETKNDTLSRILKTDSMSSFIKRAIDTKIYLEECIKGIENAMEFNLYGEIFDEAYLENAIDILNDFINIILNNLINIDK